MGNLAGEIQFQIRELSLEHINTKAGWALARLTAESRSTGTMCNADCPLKPLTITSNVTKESLCLFTRDLLLRINRFELYFAIHSLRFPFKKVEWQLQ